MSAPPPEWEADVVLSDGGTVHLRPICPEDADALVAMHGRLSEQTRYFRFFGPYPQLTPRDVTRFTVVDHDRRVAIVATLGDDLIGVARYEALGPDVAEVAFVVEDAHQGRALGPVLLDHLAAAARDRGITRFEADVLPENRRMLKVFVAAGYTTNRTFDRDTVHVTFPIQPTRQSVEVVRAREHKAEARSIARLLTPASVAVIGASEERYGAGRAVLDALVGYGFRGALHVVHPRADTVGGVPAYRTVGDVPGDVDLAVVALPAERVVDVVEQCAHKGVRGLVILSAGFAETGEPAGIARQQEVVRLAHANGMRVVGPNCLGLLNTDPQVRLDATPAATVPPAGNVGVFSQSGSLGGAILADTAARGLGLSAFVSAGNRADVSGNDLLQFWEQDPRTDVVLLYLESFGNPRKFGRLARRISTRKPVVVVRTGRGAALVPIGHDVRPVQLPREAEADLFGQAGVVLVESMAQGLDVAALLAHQPLPAGRRVAVVGNSFAVGLLALDACLTHGLSVVGGRPLDLGADASADAFRAALGAALNDLDTDAVVTVVVPPLTGPDPAVGKVVEEMSGRGDKPVVVVAPTGVAPEVAVGALAKCVGYAEWRQRPVGALPDLAGADVEAARSVAQEVLGRSAVSAAPGGAAAPIDLTDDEADRLLDAVGVRLWTAVHARTAAAAATAARRLGWPVAVKAADEHLRRRVDLGAVHLDVRSERGAREAYDAISTLGCHEVLVQRLAPAGVAVTIETLTDPSFGVVLSVGVGGIASELLGDRSYRAVPLTDVDAAEMVRSLRAAPLLTGWRGAEPVDVASLEDLLLRVSVLVDEVREIARLRLPSVLVGRSGVAVLEAAAQVAAPATRPDSGPPRL